MEIKMEHIKSHVARTYHTDQRVHVCTVVVKESATLVNKGSNLLDILLKQSQSVRIGHHDTCDSVVEKRFEVLNVDKTVLLRLDLHDLKTADGS